MRTALATWTQAELKWRVIVHWDGESPLDMEDAEKDEAEETDADGWVTYY